MDRLTLLGRNYCHLCFELMEALEPLLEGTGVEVDWVDVDQHPELEERYDELVPVLLAGDQELCHYHLDAEAVHYWLDRRLIESSAADSSV